MVRAGICQRFEAVRSAIVVAERLATPDERLDGDAAKRPRQLGLVAGVGDDGAQLGMLELIAKPDPLGVHVDGNVCRAELGERDDGIDVIGMVRKHDGHAVAPADAEPGEAIRETVARRIERGEGDHRVPEEAEGAIAIVTAPALDEIAERGGPHAQKRSGRAMRSQLI